MSLGGDPVPSFYIGSESNIPVSKHYQSDFTRNSKGDEQFLDLKKYIDNIVKANHLYNFGKVSGLGTGKANKENESIFNNERNPGIKKEKVKIADTVIKTNNSNIISSEKYKSKSKICREFQVDSKCKELNKTIESKTNQKILAVSENANSPFNIETFLKEIYPNPYYLEKVLEFQQIKNKNTKKNVMTESDQKPDTLKDENLFDVLILEDNFNHPSNEMNSQNSKSNVTEDNTTLNPTLINKYNVGYPNSEMENCILSLSFKENDSNSIGSNHSLSNKISNSKMANTNKKNDVSGKIKSKSCFTDSKNNCSQLAPQNHSKKSIIKLKSNIEKYHEELKKMMVYSKTHVKKFNTVPLEKNMKHQNDYDTGNLKLKAEILNVFSRENLESEQYIKLKLSENKKKTGNENLKNQENVKILKRNNIEANDINLIYEMMDKTAESIQAISFKSEKRNEKTNIFRDDNTEVVEFLDGNLNTAQEGRTENSVHIVCKSETNSIPKQEMIKTINSQEKLKFLECTKTLERNQGKHIIVEEPNSRKSTKEKSKVEKVFNNFEESKEIVYKKVFEKDEFTNNVFYKNKKLSATNKKPEMYIGFDDLNKDNEQTKFFKVNDSSTFNEKDDINMNCIDKLKISRNFIVKDIRPGQEEDYFVQSKNFQENIESHNLNSNERNEDKLKLLKLHEFNTYPKVNNFNEKCSRTEEINNFGAIECLASTSISHESPGHSLFSKNLKYKKKKLNPIHNFSEDYFYSEYEIPPKLFENFGDISQPLLNNFLNIEQINIPCPEIVETNNEINSLTVESHNELGGYNEREPETSDVKINLGVSKSLLPLPVRIRKKKIDSYEVIKNALEMEEKLLTTNSPNTSKSENKYKIINTNNDTINEIILADTLFKKKSIKKNEDIRYIFLKGYKNSNPNFVVCVNHLLQYLEAKNTLGVPFAVSKYEFMQSEPLIKTLKIHLGQLYVTGTTSKVSHFSYNLKEEILLLMSKIKQISFLVWFPVIMTKSKLEENYSLINSECSLSIIFKPSEKLRFLQTSSVLYSPVYCYTYNCKEQMYFKNVESVEKSFNAGLILSEDIKKGKIDNKLLQVAALKEPIQETEGKISFSEQLSGIQEENNRTNNLLTNNTKEQLAVTINKPTSFWNTQLEKNTKKVHNLLQRTYTLQCKLYDYLQRISSSTPLYGSISNEKCYTNTGALNEDSVPEICDKSNIGNRPNGYSRDKEIDKLKQESLLKSNLRESGRKIQIIDPTSIYRSPATNISISNFEQKSVNHIYDINGLPSKKKEVQKEAKSVYNMQNEDDDCSSVYSFKSSNDYSELDDFSYNKNDNPLSNIYSTNNKPLNNIIKNIEPTQKSLPIKEGKKETYFLTDKSEPQERISRKDTSNNITENKMDYLENTKNTARVLKTIFKGSESLTELSIGLKDVPMTKVKNISIEKEKFSANHTKISICISKEKSRNWQKNYEIDLKTHGKLSTYNFDKFRPSLSDCQTEYLRLQEEISKSSASIEDKESDDEDEDDYKSVVSSFSSNSISEPEIIAEKETYYHSTVNKGMGKSRKALKKHQFDFYRKMNFDISFDSRAPRKPIKSFCNYKELEPLKQALTEMQIRMRNIRRHSYLNSNEYYERALKLAKMSAGFCQSCGSRSLIPEDSFGYYRNLLANRFGNYDSQCFVKNATPHSSFYSFRSSNTELTDQFCGLGFNQSSSYLLKNRTPLFKSSECDVPVFLERR